MKRQLLAIIVLTSSFNISALTLEEQKAAAEAKVATQEYFEKKVAKLVGEAQDCDVAAINNGHNIVLCKSKWDRVDRWKAIQQEINNQPFTVFGKSK